MKYETPKEHSERDRQELLDSHVNAQFIFGWLLEHGHVPTGTWIKLKELSEGTKLTGSAIMRAALPMTYSGLVSMTPANALEEEVFKFRTQIVTFDDDTIAFKVSEKGMEKRASDLDVILKGKQIADVERARKHSTIALLVSIVSVAATIISIFWKGC